jgi:hypothetical protein
MKSRLAALRWPWTHRRSRLGLTRGGFGRVRPQRRKLRLALLGASGLVGAAIGGWFGDVLLARIAPRAARLGALEIAGNVHTEPAALVAASGLGRDLTLADVEPEALARALEAPRPARRS